MLSDERLAEIAAVDRAATPGPWFVQVPPWEPSVWAEKYGPIWRWDEDNEFLARPEDMAFIACARQAVPDLLADRAALLARMAELEAGVRAPMDDDLPGTVLGYARIVYGGHSQPRIPDNVADE